MAGPAPNFADTFTRFGRRVKRINEQYKFSCENATNWLDLYAAEKKGVSGTPGLDGEFLNADQLEQTRARYASVMTTDYLQGEFDPFIRELGRVIGATETNIYEILDRIRRYMQTNSQSLNSRGMTLDTTQAGSVTGTGTIYRLTVDEDGNTLECTGAETKTFECTKDQATGGKEHEEVFLYYGQDREKDGLQWTGSGALREIACVHALSSRLLQNPSFEAGAVTDNTALASTTQITGWTVTTAANWKTRSAATYYYRGYPGAPSTLWGLECTASDQIAQTVRTLNPGVNFDAGLIRTPWGCAVAWKRKGSATGTITLHMGAQSVAATIGSATNDVWNILFLTTGTANWYKNFKEADLDIKVVVASLAVGTVVIDDLVAAPWTNLDGTWWLALGGATAFLKGDTLSFTGDADGGSRGIFSYWLWRAYAEAAKVAFAPAIGGWFKTNNAAGETIADPA